MPKPKSIYPLKGIFTSLLSDTNKQNFLIPTYQRGYKWAANGGDGQVDILMRDLYNAYRANSPRYYLQFLTLKEKGDELEVIDGQQRLTTLSILFCVIFRHLKDGDLTNFLIAKLKYQTRQNFIEAYIYNNIDVLLDSKDWNDFKTMHPVHDNQDVFFIFNAVRAIQAFLYDRVSDIADFNNYLCTKVSLIVNLLEHSLDSEKVFVNVNKGVKLNDEDLVKGLLITRLPIELLGQKVRATEIEINELRTNMGRQWDDLNAWASRKDIKSFFKAESSNNGHLEWLIKLAFPDIPEDNSGHPMFSYLDSQNSHDRVPAEQIFATIRRTKMMLNDWFEEPETSNLLGFVLAAHRSPGTNAIWNELHQSDTKSDLVLKLKQRVIGLLPLDADGSIKDLNYEDHARDLFNLFLFLDIMKFLPIDDRKAVKYDFTKIAGESWSIEHIFPQNVKDLKSMTRLDKEDLDIIKELLDENADNLMTESSGQDNELISFHKKLFSSDNGLAVNAEEKPLLAGLLKSNAPDLHTIGNLALLLKGMNSSLSNHFFNKKREVLVEKISEGKFVPFHTYDVFSKLIIQGNTGMHTWSKSDIKEHHAYIQNQYNKIVNYLNVTHENG